jgi:hypothetical protein
MTTKNKKAALMGFTGILLLFLVSACGNSITSQQPTSTPTPTELVVVEPPTPTTPPSPCGGLAGELEVQILVGPAEAVGLEPVSVGNIPFAVTTNQEPYLIEGSGSIDYADVLVREWGTYEVTMDMSVAVSGECIDNGQTGQLDLVMELVGSQLVVVEAEGFSGEYPWEGTQTRDLAFPLEEGATAEGEGWAVLLHLK